MPSSKLVASLGLEASLALRRLGLVHFWGQDGAKIEEGDILNGAASPCVQLFPIDANAPTGTPPRMLGVPNCVA